MTAIVRNNTVDLDWVHPDDDVEGFAQRCLVGSRALMGPNRSLPSQNAVFTLRLYRRGDVAVSGMACEDGFREQAIRLATEAAIDLYDEVYPDAALAAEAFIEESIATVRQFAAIHARPHLEAGENRTGEDWRSCATYWLACPKRDGLNCDRHRALRKIPLLSSGFGGGEKS